LGAFAQLERSMIRERAIAGQVAAYMRGVRWGGQLAVLTEDDKDAVHSLYGTGWWTIKTLALAFDVSIATVNRALRDRRRPELVQLRRMPVLASHLAAYHQ
ncbi:recombinase family protein, partial [Xylophilus ampelinus]|nr:recombinase family protein [Xylophilus ampelinus]